jgi:hypothetical protein
LSHRHRNRPAQRVQAVFEEKILEANVITRVEELATKTGAKIMA